MKHLLILLLLLATIPGHAADDAPADDGTSQATDSASRPGSSDAGQNKESEKPAEGEEEEEPDCD